MAGSTIYKDLQTFQIVAKLMKNRIDNFLDDCDSFESWKDFAIKELNYVKELYEKSLIDDNEKSKKIYDELLDIFLNACDKAPIKKKEKELVNV